LSRKTVMASLVPKLRPRPAAAEAPASAQHADAKPELRGQRVPKPELGNQKYHIAIRDVVARTPGKRTSN
jgi:hypothetical protein